MKLLHKLWQNILPISTLFLLSFIPLYPKLPLIDIKNTWVYIRAEDFVVVVILLIWTGLLFKKKISLKTPLTLPILLFWLVGAASTIHAMLFVFPFIANAYPNVAFLSFLRRIEYLSLFFVSYCAIKEKRFLFHVVTVLSLTLLAVSLYGIGQKYFGFPAFLTMNEEFAKGTPIRLSALSRVPSTFAGHYDLAAYLVMVIPILVSVVFAIKNWLGKFFLLLSALFGFILLFMTVSRVSFFVLLLSLLVVLFYQKKKILLFSIPIVVLISTLLIIFSPTLLQRFGNTIKEVNVLVDAESGQEIGQVKEVLSKQFENKIIRRRFYTSKAQLLGEISETNDTRVFASSSAIVPFSILPETVHVVIPPNTSTGENLPQGTGYINLSLSPVIKRKGEFFYDRPSQLSISSTDTFMFHGDFLIKKATAYDLSFTTRFQGEWPNTIAAFKRNIFLGSGYSSVSLAVDNNYLRILGETGIFGFISFFAIFLTLGIYIKKIFPSIDSPFVKSFVLGFGAGLFGLFLNATLIDVFEASKIAYLLWLLTGITLGTLSFYKTKDIDLYVQTKKIFISVYSVALLLFVLGVTLLSKMINNYFIGDDFTWFRWVVNNNNVLDYFINSDGFFYRPGTKLYFLSMFQLFWLNQTVYHIVSFILHFSVAILFFFLARKLFKDLKLSVMAVFLFFVLTGYSEAVFWISSTGFLFTALFSIASLLLFIKWEESRKKMFFALSILCIILNLLFHELGVVTPFIILAYIVTFKENFNIKEAIKRMHFKLLFLPIPLYLILRFFAKSHWLSGDYSYNIVKLPFNIVGNTIGYFFLSLFGPLFLPAYEMLRIFLKGQIPIAFFATLIVIPILIFGCRFLFKTLKVDEKRIISFGILFFVIGLLPFLGLGNIASRYVYLASMGVVIILVFVIKKIFVILQSNGRDIAALSGIFLISLFSLLHIMQLQQIHTDWFEAGEKVKRFFISIDGVYQDYWKNEPMELYFVNVPIRYRQAWVFPVGLNDAIWFSFRSSTIRVFQLSSLEEAINQIQDPLHHKVFEFDNEGRLIERKKVVVGQ